MKQAIRNAREKAQEAPLVAGLAALGAGVAVAAALPTSNRERRAVRDLKRRSEPLKEQAVEVGREITDKLQRAAQDSIDRTKQQAVRAVWDQMKDQARAVRSS